MAIDLAGIRNENEYFTHHYLAAVLEQDLKHLFEAWSAARDEGHEPPYTTLARLAREHAATRARMERERTTQRRLELQRRVLVPLLAALGYEHHPGTRELDDGTLVPVLGDIRTPAGVPRLWLIETITPHGDEGDPLLLQLTAEQYPETDAALQRTTEPLDEIITRRIFTRREPPRWILVASLDTLVLLDRTKWNEKRLLRFDLTEIYRSRDQGSFRAMAALLHRESIVPDDGIPLIDTLDENSHRHAFAVSADLKYSAREAVELLGNEAVHYIRTVRREVVYGTPVDAEQLTRECLRYLYRLLFLFYVEARPELRYTPMASEEYRTGYSLESLRDLELVPLDTDESREGTYIHESLQLLFRIVREGFNIAPVQGELDWQQRVAQHTFSITPLNSHLFDPAGTPLLNGVRFRNHVLQRVIALLSLSRPRGARERRGRISYAQLGINQLGAVYEALLSYSGFFATADLYEVRRADEPADELGAAWFVTAADLPQYRDDEIVRTDDGRVKILPRGSFIYRLSGRTREKSASYYTPEVLTRCLVSYALKELLADATADDILHLHICEMALGSGAFANEAVNQLADAYLERRQRETGRSIPHDSYAHERQKVKMLLADNNVFGVDLNPVAVELAEVSLWLNTMFEGAWVPWFGMQLVAGNSLVGARRAVLPTASLVSVGRKGGETWLDRIPDRVPLRPASPPAPADPARDPAHPGEAPAAIAPRPAATVYHFLLPDRGMAEYADKVIGEMAGAELRHIKAWRKEFTRPFSAGEAATLARLSDAVDRLWNVHADMQRSIRIRTTDFFPVFGREIEGELRPPTTTAQKDRIFREEFLSKDVRNSSPYRRLKMVMDYWCALWYWPIEHAQELPTRDEYLMELSMLLEGGVYDAAPADAPQLPLFATTAPVEEQQKLVDAFGYVNVDALVAAMPRLGLVARLNERHRFHHWELEFADVFARRGGFDLIVGNPPWIRVEWNEGGLLGDHEPLFHLRKHSASEIAKLRAETIEKRKLRAAYLAEFEEMTAAQNFLNARQNYPVLQGSQSNLYKCFLPQAWMIANAEGVTGFLHPEGVYDDPKGGPLRAEIYPRLRYHFQFQNGLNLFAEIAHRERYSINVSSNSATDDFISISNLFHPVTIDQSFTHSGYGRCDGIKNDENEWNLAGHRDRMISVTSGTLELFATLFDETGTPGSQARLPVVHTRQLIDVLRAFATAKQRLSDLADKYQSTVMWDETNAQKNGTISRRTEFPSSQKDLIVSGPHFYGANPSYKSPRAICKEKSDYSIIDHLAIPDDYLPRTNYAPACSDAEYQKRTPTVPWDGTRITEHYRLISRKMLPPPNERTLTSALIPRYCGHTNGALGMAFQDPNLLITILAQFVSLPFDFFVKSTGKTNLYDELASTFPVLETWTMQVAARRALALNCLTSHFAELWRECWDASYLEDRWSKRDPRLPDDYFTNLTPEWRRDCALRSDYARRQALIEIDVLVAMALGMTLDDLCTIYRIQFPVLRQNESDTWYDRRGRIVFTCSKGLVGVGFPRTARPKDGEPLGWEDIRHLESGTVTRTVLDDFLPGDPRSRTITYEAPFDRCDRETDYTTAWHHLTNMDVP